MEKRIGIIGGGASGVLTAIQCWRRLGAEAQIVIFDPAQELGRGKAYSTRDTEYLLNVPVSKMSAFPGDPDHFANWVTRHDPKIRESRHWPFVPRQYFGQYLEEQLRLIPSKNLVHIRSKVASISPGVRDYKVQLEGGNSRQVDYLVIATGYGSDPKLPFDTQFERLKDRVLQSSAIENLPPETLFGRVLIVGSGLTALDIWKRLRKNPGLSFTFVSRRGLFPEPHESHGNGTSRPIELPTLAGMSPIQVLQVLRCIRRSHSVPWAAVADRVRAHAQKIWTCWTDKEKARFVRHLKPYWEVIRHRIPASVAENIGKDIETGRIEIVSGRIQSVRESERLSIQFQSRNREIGSLEADWIVVATGSSIQQSLIQAGSIRGIRPCPHGFGYINDSAPRVWLVGPSSKAVFWEITAISDIREQAFDVAASIAKDRQPHGALVIQRLSTHPESVGETYFAHLKASTSFAVKMWKLGCFALVHAVLPFFHLDTTSSNLRNLAPVLSKRRQRVSATPSGQSSKWGDHWGWTLAGAAELDED